jgi:hypothetical protein
VKGLGENRNERRGRLGQDIIFVESGKIEGAEGELTEGIKVAK